MQCSNVIHRRGAKHHQSADHERAVYVGEGEPQIRLQTLLRLLMELHDLVLFPSERVHHSNGTEPLLGLCEHRAFLFLDKC